VHPVLRRASVLSSLAALALALPAQATVPQIAGRVVRADNGMPIQGATITLLPPYTAGVFNPQSAKTDGNGEYKFESVKDDVYTIQASAEGFVTLTYNRDGTLEGGFQKVNASTTLLGVDFHLRTEAVIRGLVTDMQGSPVGPGVAVAAAARRKTFNGGIDHFSPVANSVTDGGGRFVLKGLPPGSYFVCVNGPAGSGAKPDAGGWYQETWYGDKPSAVGALQLSLKEGEEKDDIRISVKRESRYQVIVRPMGPQGEPAPDRYDVVLLARNHTSVTQKDGSSLIPDIPPGHYTLVSTAWSGVQYVGQGETDFDVSDADVTLSVQVGGLGEIRGIVEGDGKLGQIPEGLKVDILSSSAAEVSAISPDGHFSFDRVLPGRYTFKLRGEPPGTVLRSVRCNAAEVTLAAPLRVGDKQKVTDCDVVLAKDRN
jgi:hypothetical protein